jgi:3-methyladenine DNA glycosylase/8-oxoguanine DNA glycosylase
MGYRGPYVSEIARQVVAGKLDLEGWLTSDLPTPDLKKELLAVKGVGNYAAATMLMLLGRYDELAVDTVFRDFVSKKYFGGDRPADAEMAAVYEKWGEWKYLAYWFDIWMDLDETL